MLRPMAIALSGALLLAACGSSGENQPRDVPPVPPSYNPPRNLMAPLPNGQQAAFNDNAPAANPSAPLPNPQQPTPPPRSGAGGLPPQVVQLCRNLCGSVQPRCSESCQAYCDASAFISANCASAAAALLVCYAQQGAECNQDGELDLPQGRCRNELVDSMPVSEACLDDLFP